MSLGEWGYPIVRNGELWTIGLDGFVKKRLAHDTPFVSGKVPVADFTGEYLARLRRQSGSVQEDDHRRELRGEGHPEPFTVFHRGRAVLTATPSGDMLALVFDELNGRSVDICQALAGAP